jgi:hypothetical protein
MLLIINILLFYFNLYFLDLNFTSNLVFFTFFYTNPLFRVYLSETLKLEYSNKVPSEITEIIYGLMLGDGNIRINGNHALLSVQQTDESLVNNLWDILKQWNLVSISVKTLNRHENHKTIYYFQTLTIPYFTELYSKWYGISVNGKRNKILPSDIYDKLTPVALAHWIIGDGSFDGHGRGIGRLSLHTENFTLDEVNILKDVLLQKFNIESNLRKGVNADPTRGYVIRIPAISVVTVRDLCKDHVYPSMKYKLGLK